MPKIILSLTDNIHTIISFEVIAWHTIKASLLNEFAKEENRYKRKEQRIGILFYKKCNNEDLINLEIPKPYKFQTVV